MNLSLTNQKCAILAMNVIFGAILIYSYYHYITKGGVPDKMLWGKIYKLKKVYLASMILAAIGYLLLLLFVVFKTPNTKVNNGILSNLLVIQVLIVVVSMLWLPMTLAYLKEKTNKTFTMVAVLLILFIVALASAKQFLLVRNLTPESNNCAKTMKTLAKLGAGYFFVHTFFFDFVGWDIGFFSK